MTDFKSHHMQGYLRCGKLGALTAKYTADQLEFADAAFAMCEKYYDAGGDRIVECYEVADIIKVFPSMHLAAVRELCGIMVDRAADARWGDDTDPELETVKRHAQWVAEAHGEQADHDAQRRASHRWES